jgi:signal transduction histidine kinase
MLILDNLTKFYGQNSVFDTVSLTIEDQQVVGMIDYEDQAVTELANVLSGQYLPDSGNILLDGQSITRRFLPIWSRLQPIGIIRREPQLVEALDIANSLYLGQEPPARQRWQRWLRVFDEYQVFHEAQHLLAKLNFTLPALHTRVGDLSMEQRQLIVIARLCIKSPRVIVIDQPGYTLSLPYQEQLFELIRAWRSAGKIIILGTANLDTLFAVCDRILVLRGGKIVVDSPVDQLTREEILAALVSNHSHRQLTPVIWALDSYYQSFRQAQLLRHKQQLLEQDLAQQNTIRQELLDLVSTQLTALDNANTALQDAQRRLLTQREDERKYLARELHDQIIQDLLTCNYQLEELGEAYPELHEAMEAIRHSLRNMVEELRRICGRLRPPTIDSFGLGATLQSYTSSWSERTGIGVELVVDSKLGRLTEEIELSLFRIIQEGLINAAKHANASAVSIHLTTMNSRMLQLIIADNGIGLAEEFDLGTLSNTGHFGMLGITERVALLGGRIVFRNQPTGGLQIHVEIPYPTLAQMDRYTAFDPQKIKSDQYPFG